MLLWYIIFFCFHIFYNVINSCDVKLNFQQPLLQSFVSHNPSEIMLIWCLRNISIINVENFHKNDEYFCEICDTVLFQVFMNRQFKTTSFIIIISLMSLLDKSINKKANYWMEVFANCVMAFL